VAEGAQLSELAVVVRLLRATRATGEPLIEATTLAAAPPTVLRVSATGAADLRTRNGVAESGAVDLAGGTGTLPGPEIALRPVAEGKDREVGRELGREAGRELDRELDRELGRASGRAERATLGWAVGSAKIRVAGGVAMAWATRSEERAAAARLTKFPKGVGADSTRKIGRPLVETSLTEAARDTRPGEETPLDDTPPGTRPVDGLDHAAATRAAKSCEGEVEIVGSSVERGTAPGPVIRRRDTAVGKLTELVVAVDKVRRWTTAGDAVGGA
jgi:hypothetical protein